MRTNHRPDFILLSNQSADREDPVLYPDQWEERVSLAGRYDCFLFSSKFMDDFNFYYCSNKPRLPAVSEFQVKEACPAAVGGRQDKPSPDSGCSLGFSSRLSSPNRPAGDGERHCHKKENSPVCALPHYCFFVSPV